VRLFVDPGGGFVHDDEPRAAQKGVRGERPGGSDCERGTHKEKYLRRFRRLPGAGELILRDALPEENGIGL
jgi:hypothetical protein